MRIILEIPDEGAPKVASVAPEATPAPAPEPPKESVKPSEVPADKQPKANEQEKPSPAPSGNLLDRDNPNEISDPQKDNPNVFQFSYKEEKP